MPQDNLSRVLQKIDQADAITEAITMLMLAMIDYKVRLCTTEKPVQDAQQNLSDLIAEAIK